MCIINCNTTTKIYKELYGDKQTHIKYLFNIRKGIKWEGWRRTKEIKRANVTKRKELQTRQI